ncbi:MAG TPA: ABC transporter permease [Thermoplasmata archaeon]|nr:ABC transporter permease [Thermoplasmata archaeon]
MTLSSEPGPAGPAQLGRVPESAMQALLMSRYQFRDYLRSQRFLLMLSIVGIIAAILSAVVLHYRPSGLIDSSTSFYGNLWVEGAGVLIVFAGIIFGGDAIAGEFQNKTGYFLMGLPIKRWSVYAGKYLAAFLASLLTILVYFVYLVLFAAYFMGARAISGPLFESLGLAVLYLSALLGFVFLFSSLFKSSLYAVLVVAVLFLFGFSIIQALVVGLVHIEPWFLLSYASNLTNSVMAYPFVGVPPHMVTDPITGNTSYNPSYAEGIAIIVGYFLWTTIGGLLLFEREEFT